MIGVVTYWNEQVLVNSKILDTDIWKDTIRPLGGTHLLIVDQSNLNPQWGDISISYENYPTLETIFNAYPDSTYVYLESTRNIPENISYTYLKDFVHPAEDVIYVTSCDESVLPIGELPMKGNNVVAIETIDELAIWAVVVAGVVLYDRMVKVK